MSKRPFWYAVALFNLIGLRGSEKSALEPQAVRPGLGLKGSPPMRSSSYARPWATLMRASGASESARALERQAVRPGLGLQVHEHALLQLVLAVADRDAVVVPVQAVDQRLRATAGTWYALSHKVPQSVLSNW